MYDLVENDERMLSPARRERKEVVRLLIYRILLLLLHLCSEESACVAASFQRLHRGFQHVLI